MKKIILFILSVFFLNSCSFINCKETENIIKLCNSSVLTLQCSDKKFSTQEEKQKYIQSLQDKYNKNCFVK